MGIQGLTSFLDANPSLFERIKLGNTKVVIDGAALVRFVLERSRNRWFNQRFGGLYQDMAVNFREFFELLHSKGIDPIVISCGIGIPPSKFDQHKADEQERLLPTLANTVVNEVTKEMRIGVIRNRFERGMDLVRVANELNAPLMSNTSDFYLFNVNKGFINLDQCFKKDGPNGDLLRFGSKLRFRDSEPEPKSITKDNVEGDVFMISVGSEKKVFTESSDFSEPEHLNNRIRQQLSSIEISEEAKTESTQPWKPNIDLEASVFYLQKLLDKFPGLSPEVLPLIAVILGCRFRPRDYNDDTVFRGLFKLPRVDPKSEEFMLITNNHRKIYNLFHWLRNKSLDEAIYAYEELLRKFTDGNHIQRSTRLKVINDIKQWISATWAAKNWLDGQVTTPCLMVHFHGCECKVDHSFSVPIDTDDGQVISDKSLPNPIARRLIDHDLSSSIPKIFFYGKLALRLFVRDIKRFNTEDLKVNMKAAIELRKYLTAMLCNSTNERDDFKPKYPLPKYTINEHVSLPFLKDLPTNNEERSKLINAILGLDDDKRNEDICSTALTILINLDEKNNAQLKEILNHLLSLLTFTFLFEQDDQAREQFKRYVYAQLITSVYYVCGKALFISAELIQDCLIPERDLIHPEYVNEYLKFQEVVHEFISINSLLENPIQCIKPSQHFNGILIYNLMTKITIEDIPVYVQDLFRVKEKEKDELKEFLARLKANV